MLLLLHEISAVGWDLGLAAEDHSLTL